jgi:NTP pyrophosphatase (non-canonical NTP hydrolase)
MPTRSLKVFAEDCWKWSKRAFGDEGECPFIGAARHLVLESIELLTAAWMLYRARQRFGGSSIFDADYQERRQALTDAMNAFSDELADCFLLVLDTARRAGVDADGVIQAAEEKLARNKRRKWGDGQGVRIAGKPVHHKPQMGFFAPNRFTGTLMTTMDARTIYRFYQVGLDSRERELELDLFRPGFFSDVDGPMMRITAEERPDAITLNQKDALAMAIPLVLFGCMGDSYRAELTAEYLANNPDSNPHIIKETSPNA